MGDHSVTRRWTLRSLGVTAGVAALGNAPLLAQSELDLSDPKDTLHAVVKLRGNVTGGRVLQTYAGTLSLLLPGRVPTTVCSYQGVIRTDWTPRRDGSFAYRTFDLGYFGDLETGDFRESLVNPITGAQVRPTLIEDGPIERIYSVDGIYWQGATPPDGARLSIPWERAGDHIWYSSDFTFEYDNPLPPSTYPNLSSTDRVVQRNTFTYKGRWSDLNDPGRVSAPSETLMSAISTIHPWLEMGAFQGFQMVSTIAHKIDGVEQIAAPVRAFMESYRADFLSAETPFVGAGNSFERYKRDRIDAD